MPPVRQLVALVLAVVLWATVAPSASGDNAGQLGAHGEFGSEAGQFRLPGPFGAEPDGSYYVGDRPEGYTSFRIQKFSRTGELDGSVSISTPAEELFQGIAVDPQKGRFYVARNPYIAGQLQPLDTIFVFSTTPDKNGNLVPPKAGPATLPVPTGAATVFNPSQIVVDPSSGELEILGQDANARIILQRIGTDGSGTIGARFTDTVPPMLGAVAPEQPIGVAMALAPDGTTYLVRNVGNYDTRAFTLNRSFVGGLIQQSALSSSLSRLFEQTRTEGANPIVDGNGPQIGVSEDGRLLYVKYLLNGGRREVDSGGVGSYLINGFSLADNGVSVEQSYGAGPADLQCRITGTGAALAPVGEGLVVLDSETDTEVAEFGDHVLEFGPHGSGCPEPTAADVLRAASGEVTAVERGTAVTLDATGSDLGEWGQAFESAVWTIEGPEGAITETVSGKSASQFKVQHTFLNPGSYTIRLSVKVELDPKLPAKLNHAHPLEGGTPTVFSALPQTLNVTGVGNGPPPTLSGLSPISGPEKGQNTVTISGTGFTGTPTVKFGSVSASEVEVVGPETVKVTAPEGTAGTAVDVSVTTADGITRRTEADRYVYEGAGGGSGPGGSVATVTGVSPAHGPVSGGNAVTITGTDLDGARRVYFAAAAATSVAVIDSSTVTATVPPGVQGTSVDVTVVNGSGTSAPGPADIYQYDPLMQGLGVVKVGSGTGTVSSADAEINCGTNCSAAYPQGATVVLNASPAPGSTFTGWGGACSGRGPCVVGMTGTRGVTASFEGPPAPPVPRAAPAAPARPPAAAKLKCKAGRKLKKVGGKPKCVKVKPKKKPARHKKKPAKKKKTAHGKSKQQTPPKGQSADQRD